MRVRRDLVLLLSGSLGFDLSDPLDCNAWLIDTGEGWALIDAGVGRDPEAVLAAIAAEGIAPGTVRWLLLTHAHADHSGGAAAMRARLGACVVTGPDTARLMQAGDPAAISLPRAQQAGVYPEDYVWRGCEVDRVEAPGARFTIGQMDVEVIGSPGHSADHVCYRIGASLFVGDALFAGGRVALQDVPDCSVPDTIATVRRLAAQAFDAFLPGHGVFSLQRGQRHTASAMAAVNRLQVPPPF